MQSCQCAVEHVPHCSQQLEAGKHLVKEVREGLLGREREQLGTGGYNRLVLEALLPLYPVYTSLRSCITLLVS